MNTFAELLGNPTEFYEGTMFNVEDLHGKVGEISVESVVEDGVKYVQVGFLDHSTGDCYVIAELEEEV